MFFEKERRADAKVQARHNLFDYIYSIETSSLCQNQLDVILYLVTATELIALELQLAGLIAPIVLPNIVIIILGSVYGLVLLESVIGVAYFIRMPFLKDQYKVIRYILNIPMVMYILQLADQSDNFWLVLLYLFIVLLLLIQMVLINIYILPTDLTDLKTTTPLGVTLSTSQILCVALSVLSTLHPISSTLKFLVALLTNKIIEKSYNNELLEIRVYRFLSRLLLAIYFLSVWRQLAGVAVEVVVIAMVMGAAVFVFMEAVRWVKDRTVEYEHVEAEVVEVKVFLRNIREVLTCLEMSKENIKLKGRCSATLINYLIQHNTYCVKPQCRIHKNGGLNPVELLKKPDQIELFIDRISDELTDTVQRFSEEHPNNFNVMACQLMLTRSLKQKFKSAEITRVAQQDVNSLRLRYYIYSMNKSIETLQIDQDNANEAFRFQQMVLQFKNSIMMMLKRMIEFWQFCDQQVVDVQRIIIISNKVNFCRLRVKQLWHNISQVQTYTTIHILNMYISFVKYMNEHEQAFELEKHQSILVSAMSLNKMFKYVAGEEYCVKEEGVVVVSINQSHLGMIDCCNKYFGKILGYTQKELAGNTINCFMPDLYSKVHDSILKGFLEQPQKIITNCSQQPLFAKHRNGYIFPVEIKLKKSSGLELKVMAVMKARCPSLKEIYFITDRFFNILDISSKFEKLTPEKSRNKEFSQIFINVSEEDINNTLKKEISLTEIDMEIRGKQYLTNINISKLKIRDFNDGYLFTFDLTKLSVYIKRLSSNLQSKDKRFIWSYRDECFMGGNRPLNETNSLDQDGFQFSTEQKRNRCSAVSSIKKQILIEYGKGIRPIRLFNGDYIRLDDWGMDQDQQSDNQQIIDTGQTHSSQINFQQLTPIGRFIKRRFNTFLYFIIIAYIALIIYHIMVTLSTLTTNTSVIHINYSRYRVKNSVSMFASKQLVDRFLQLPTDLYKSQENITRVIQSIIFSSKISQVKYQQLQQLLYLNSQYSFPRLTDPSLLTFPIQPLTPAEYFSLYLLIAVSFLLILVYYANLTTFGNSLLKVIQVFLKLEDAVIKYMSFECVRYFKEVESNGDKMNEEADLSAFEDENMIERRRVKKIKNKRGNAFKDCLKLIMMLTALVVYILLIMMVQRLSDVSVEELNKFEIETTDVVGLGSQTIICKLTSLIFNSPLPQFSYNIQSLNYIPRSKPQWQISQIQQYLYSNICPNFPHHPNCVSTYNGVLTFGANTAYNTFLQHFHSNEFSSNQQLIEMIEMFYNYLWPVYDDIINRIQKKLLAVSERTTLVNVGLVVPVFFIIFVEILAMTAELSRKRDQTAILKQITNMIPYKFRTRHISATCGNYTAVLNTESVD